MEAEAEVEVHGVILTRARLPSRRRRRCSVLCIALCDTCQVAFQAEAEAEVEVHGVILTRDMLTGEIVCHVSDKRRRGPLRHRDVMMARAAERGSTVRDRSMTRVMDRYSHCHNVTMLRHDVTMLHHDVTILRHDITMLRHV